MAGGVQFKHLKDPETGLSWRDAEVLERTRKLRIENKQSERALDDGWVTAEYHRKVITLIVEALEHIPGKAKSELGLSEPQTKELRRMLDEARHAAASGI